MTYKSFTSIIGMFLSGVYLFLCCVLGYSVITEEENAIGFGSALIIITAPWSFWLSKNQFGFDDHRYFYLILAVGAVFNAIILYLIGLLISRLIRSMRDKIRTPQV